MSCVQDSSDCPRCKLLGTYIFDSKSGDYSFQCHFCGFLKQVSYTKEKSSDDWNVDIQEINPVGAICIVYRKGRGKLAGRSPRSDEDEIARFKEFMKEPDVDREKSYLTRWDPEKKKVIYLVGNPEKEWKKEMEIHNSEKARREALDYHDEHAPSNEVKE